MATNYILTAREFGEEAKLTRFVERFTAINGLIRHADLRKHENRPVLEVINEIIKTLQDSEAYHHIVVKKWEDGAFEKTNEVIIDWHMNAETMDRRMVEYAQYLAQREELDKQAKALLAQIRKLDRDWRL